MSCLLKILYEQDVTITSWSLLVGMTSYTFVVKKY